MRRYLPVIGLAFVLVGCEASRPPPAAPTPGLSLDVGHATARYRVDVADSSVRVYVHREGPLAQMGHNHALLWRPASGTVVQGSDPRAISGVLSFNASDVVIDAPDERRLGGDDYPGEISQSGIEGTRHNMLGPAVLDAEQAPAISISLDRLTGDAPDQQRVAATITVRGRATAIEAPVRLRDAPDGARTAEGSLTLSQRALGLEPFSVAMGALRVADALEVRFRFVLRPERADSGANGGS